MTTAWPWILVASLGAYHGFDPSMGWLFAVALGLQERRRANVVWALGPIALARLLGCGLPVGRRLVGLAAIGLRLAALRRRRALGRGEAGPGLA